MFLINIDRNKVDVPHRDKMTSGSSGFLVAETNFSKEWYRTDLEIYVYFASTTGLRVRKKLVDLLGKPLYECAWDEFPPRIPISALATAEPGTVQIGFMAQDDDENLVIPTVWGTLGQVEKSVLSDEEEVPEPEDPVPGPAPDGGLSSEDVLEIVARYLSDNHYITNEQLREALSGIGESSAGVQSFNGRIGVVYPNSGDYSPEMVGIRPITKSELEEILQ